ncbi:YggS family pyridoxal phosphate-dependent enzyme [Oceanotoga teriensis]|jgi:hypothetical protein|uniref:Pyridoxal phosphate homeostasis protein n=1 Tax=Oceanotoga teriensis TaxID=515440 RepID=A0AA45C8Y3_9BACT|nr:YggS family pyridoxal phosphate-dependent enzyme [Oceanotoga teriensis]MDO7975393.1 YggS family pyridoxal phosphate-dependent enzyme [Oceanotoga teriensis]PWJ96319.1 hypothetical protein C7380_102237 [Oceanotoga teriensis]
MNSIESNLNELYDELKIYPNTKLIAVSKFFPVEDIVNAYNFGQRIFGESKAQELRDKSEYLSNYDINWHFIGRLQTNKIKYIVPRCELIHSVSRIKEIKEINFRAEQNNKIQNILIEVNISQEDSKSGIDKNSISNFLKECSIFKNIKINGFMTMAPLTDDENIIESVFFEASKLLNSFKFSYPDLKELSMGMTNDYKLALKHGATFIRIGSKIFGNRNY